MKRSTFIKSLIGAQVLTNLSRSLAEKEPGDQKMQKGKNIEKLAGFTLHKLQKQYSYDLFDDFLPFMEKYVIDHEYGGFMCNTNREGKNVTQNKNIWYEGRGIWVYSFLYNNLRQDQMYLEVAQKSVEFVMKHKPTQENLWPHAYSREGKPIENRLPNLYGDLFLANGLAEYSKAANDAKYFQLAKEILLKCLRLYDNPEYSYDVYYGPKVEQKKGQRVLGHWMVILRLVTQMLENKPDQKLEKIANRCIQAIMNQHHNPEFDLINEVLDHDMTIPDNAFAQFVYTGHAIETLWMVLYEAARKKDIRLFQQAARRFRRHLEVAWDDVYGGAFRCLIHVDDNIWEVDKVLWLQEEILIGLLFIIEHTGAHWAKDWFDTMYRYVKDKYPLKQYGFPLWILGGDRKVTFERESERVGNFHHPRHLMLNLLSLDRIINRKGVVSNLFADEIES